MRGFDWTFGQAGFSVHVADGMETILGAPGIHDWKGSVIQLRDGDYPRLRRNGVAEEFGKFYQAPQLVMKPQLETSWNQNATYFGTLHQSLELYALSICSIYEFRHPLISRLCRQFGKVFGIQQYISPVCRQCSPWGSSE